MLKKYLNPNLISNWNGFAHITAEQIIDDANPIAQQFSKTPEKNLASRLVCQSFDELTGCEEALAEILSGKLPYLEFNQINRPSQQGKTTYLDFKIIRVDPNDPAKGMILLIRNSQIEA